MDSEVLIPVGDLELAASLSTPDNARGVVLFAHGSGSSRHSPRNKQVAERLAAVGLQTVLLDLLTPGEEDIDLRTAQWRFDIDLLARRLVGACDWAHSVPEVSGRPLGLFGASTGAAAALRAAAERPDRITAVVSRGGRPDLAGEALYKVQAPTLLIVGGEDYPVVELNQRAALILGSLAETVIIPGASHLFTEPGALERVADLSAQWFGRWLGGDS